MKEDEVGRAYGTHGGVERCLQSFGWEILKEETIGKT
jgi:hypothetical protein